MKRFAKIAVLFVVVILGVLALKSRDSSDVTTTVEYNAEGERVYPESQIAKVDVRDGDAEIRLDDAPAPLTEDELAALPWCKQALDALKVGPPLGDKTRCRTTKGGETLLTVALEDSLEWEFVGPGEKMRRKIM